MATTMSNVTISKLAHIDEYGERTLIGVCWNVRGLKAWSQRYRIEQIHVVQTQNGCNLNIVYADMDKQGLESITFFQTVADAIHLIKHWHSLNRDGEFAIDYYFNMELISNNKKEFVKHYESQQYS